MKETLNKVQKYSTTIAKTKPITLHLTLSTLSTLRSNHQRALIKLRKPTSNTISVHYSPDQVTGDQIHHEALVRGDDTKNSQSLQSEQPDQFHYNDESNLPAANSNHKRINVVVSSRGQARSNEQRLIDLYSVKGGVSEVTNSASQSLQLTPANIHQRARVISVTPAPDHEAQYEASERSQIRRVVVSKPIQRDAISTAYRQRLTARKSTPTRSQSSKQEYVTPVPQNIAHLRAGHPPENY